MRAVRTLLPLHKIRNLHERLGLTTLKPGPELHGHGHEYPALQIEQFFAVPRPSWGLTARGGYLHWRPVRQVLHVDLKASRLIRAVREPLAVWRESTETFVSRSLQERMAVRSPSMGSSHKPSFIVSLLWLNTRNLQSLDQSLTSIELNGPWSTTSGFLPPAASCT